MSAIPFRIGLVVLVALAGCSAKSGTLDPTAGGDVPPDYGWVFDETQVRDYYLTVDTAALAVMDTETYQHGTFQCGDVTLGDVGVRYKGNSSYNYPGPKKSFKVDFNEFVAGQKFHGFKKLNFNNNFKDPSLMREKLAYDLFRAAGVPCPRTAHCNLYLNGVLQGVYTLIQQVDNTMLATHFADNSGNLFKVASGGNNLTWVGSDPAAYTAEFDLETNELANDYSGLIHFVDVLNNTPDLQFQTEIEKVFNVDPFLSWLAVDVLLSNLDDYCGSGQNYYLYLNPATGKVEFMPWDVNEAFGNFRSGWTADEMLTLDIYQPFSKPPTAPAFCAVWGSGPANVLAVGEMGMSDRYNGTAWTPGPTGQNRRLNGLWGSAPSNVRAVGDNGTVLRFNGTGWAPETTGVTEPLRGIWGASATDIFAVGDANRILHWDGSSWTLMTTGTGPSWNGVWGTSGTDVFAVGSGSIRRYNGTSWAQMPLPYPGPPSPPPPPFFGVWGTASNNVFAVGGAGAILRYDGSSWTQMTSNVTTALRAVWGTSSTNVYAAGDGGVILHWDGSNWTAMTSGTTENLLAAWGSSATDLFVVGRSGTILHGDGSTWTAQDCGITPPAPSPRPLVTRILAVPAYKASYEAKLAALLSGGFSTATMNAAIDAIYARIQAHVYNDTLKQYTNADFDNSIGQDIPPAGVDRTLGLKPFVSARGTSVQGQLP